jgi:alkylation response protein AidB-like acyl-CoA dehydrogenase
MEIELSTEEAKFSDEVRDFIAQNLPGHIAEKVRLDRHLEKDDYLAWQQTLGRKGWHAFTWPKEHGGPGWSVMQRYLFESISAELDCPTILPFGPRMAGPVVYTFGTQLQKDRFLPGIRESSVWWCQGYSEPQSGSDLASLSTRAEKRGDHYVVNGQKIWTTYAHYADWMFCLVRTSKEDRPQKGISFLLIDMKSPGIKVQPIRMLEGSHSFNAVFLDNVEVPADNLIGKEGEGWTYAKFLLELERVDNAAVGATKAALRRLKIVAAREQAFGRCLLDDPIFQAKLVGLEAQLMSLEITGLRALSKVAGGSSPGPISSLLKVRGAEIAQQISQLASEAIGYFSLPLQPEQLIGTPNSEPIGRTDYATAANMYFWKRSMSIYGGSNEIQRNIIARQILSL